jgi:hypothetical protein
VFTRTTFGRIASSNNNNNNNEKEDIFEVISENLPFFIGGIVAGTFGLSVTDDSSPLKGWVEDRKNNINDRSNSSVLNNKSRSSFTEPLSASSEEEKPIFTVPTTQK